MDSKVLVASPVPSVSADGGKPASAGLLWFYTLSAVVCVIGFCVLGASEITSTVAREWRGLTFWIVLLALVQLLPLRVEDFALTIDLPVSLAVSFIYPLEVAAAVAFLGAFDLREILSPRVSFDRALFNRAQIALSVVAAGAVFRLVGGGLEVWPAAVLGTLAAVATDYSVNAALVAVHISLRRGLSWRRALARLWVGEPRQFLATYVGYSAMALVIAHLWLQVGAWSVVAFLIPNVIARQMLLRAQRLKGLMATIQNHERLLERALDRIADERKDERLLIAGDLHDEVMQSLIRTRMLVGLLRAAPTPESADVNESIQACDDAISSLRSVVRDLRESPLGTGGLVPALRNTIRELRLDWRANISSALSLPTTPPAQVQVALYQVAREALLNSVKHAQAEAIGVTLGASDEEIVLSVEDNGVGFKLRIGEPQTSFGLELMGERVERIGGKLMIESHESKGTRISVTVPVQVDRSSNPRPQDDAVVLDPPVRSTSKD